MSRWGFGRLELSSPLYPAVDKFKPHGLIKIRKERREAQPRRKNDKNARQKTGQLWSVSSRGILRTLHIDTRYINIKLRNLKNVQTLMS